MRLLYHFIALAALLCTTACAQDNPGMGEYAAAVRAPELEPNLGWLNTDKPLRFNKELKGQVVLLDFWTYCCINCIHILPDLEYLEKKYADQPVMVIGVHSAKFENEANRETIRAAVQRYKIKHPVVIDEDMAIWDKYTAQGWPTFVLIDSRGRVVAMDSGEGHREAIDALIQKLLDQGKAQGTLADKPVPVNAGESLMPTGDVAFPGKIEADKKTGRLYVADSNHNRVVVTTLPDDQGKARLAGVIGSGREGTADGPFDKAEFHNPQGMALLGDKLYIADTDNHLIRVADFATSTVTTIAGTGKQGYDRRGGKTGRQQEISSPWDVAVDGDRLYIAMAGTHQVWLMNLKTGVVAAFSGNGRENIVDGPPAEVNFAQPSGLALLDNTLYVADSEVSGLRAVNTATGNVVTIVGKGLFVFGDKDGRGDDVRLQHALGLAENGDNLLLADTYNHRIKRVNPATREVTSLYGTGKPGAAPTDGQPAFFEPGGLAVAGGNLYVADTNNHRVMMINLATSSANEVMIDGLTAPDRPSRESETSATLVPSVVLDSQASTLTITLRASLPAGAHPSPEAPMLVKMTDGEKVLFQTTLRTDKLPVVVEVPHGSIKGLGSVTIEWRYAWCTEGNTAVCVPVRKSWLVPITHSDVGGAAISLQ